METNNYKNNELDNYMLFYSNVDNILFILPKVKLNTFGDATSMLHEMKNMTDILNEIGETNPIYCNQIAHSQWLEANWVFWKIIPYPKDSIYFSNIKPISYRMWYFIEELTQ